MIDSTITLPSMTEDAAARLRKFGVTTRASLHENIAYQPRVIAYIADVSITRVELWLRELEQDAKVAEVQP